MRSPNVATTPAMRIQWRPVSAIPNATTEVMSIQIACPERSERVVSFLLPAVRPVAPL